MYCVLCKGGCELVPGHDAAGTGQQGVLYYLNHELHHVLSCNVRYFVLCRGKCELVPGHNAAGAGQQCVLYYLNHELHHVLSCNVHTVLCTVQRRV